MDSDSKTLLKGNSDRVATVHGYSAITKLDIKRVNEIHELLQVSRSASKSGNIDLVILCQEKIRQIALKLS